jgi:hypothetical protein
MLKLTIIVIVSVVDPVAAQSQQPQSRSYIEVTYESMLLGSSLGALKEQDSVLARIKEVLLPSVVCWLRTREEGRRMRVKEDPLRAHLLCERPLRVRTNEERREEEPRHDES